MRDLRSIATDKPVLIAGPTASGKSALALDISEAQGGLIVNADALQVYDCWQVLSARPGAEDLARAPHALYGHVTRDQPYSVGDWLSEIADLKASGARLIIIGGTGLYLSSLTQGISKLPAITDEIRTKANTLRVTDFEQMKADLLEKDPILMNRIDTNNPMRVQRGWEVFEATGTPLSVWQSTKGAPMIAPEEATKFLLEAPKDWLTPRIAQRFSAMLDAGAVEEVRANAPFWENNAPWTRAIGASELKEYLSGQISLETAQTRAIIATRQYAKRQRTWFRARMSTWNKIDASSL